MKLALLFSLLFILPSCQEERKRTRPENQKKAKGEDDSEKEKKSLLNVPAGAVMEDLVLSYHDDDQKKISLLTIKKLTVADDFRTEEAILKGEDLKLWLFDDEGTIASTTIIPMADYLVEKEQLVAESEILMIGSDGKFATQSKGGTFSLETGQAFLLGPTTSKFKFPPKKEKTAP
ncbi:MAG: hypothetical protein ABF379_14375 [Akkermansiaceae bacterium]